MFDNIPQGQKDNQAITPADTSFQSSRPAEDIFSATDSTEKPMMPVSDGGELDPSLVFNETSGNDKKYIIIGASVLVVLLLIAGGVFAYKKSVADKQATQNIPNVPAAKEQQDNSVKQDDNLQKNAEQKEPENPVVAASNTQEKILEATTTPTVNASSTVDKQNEEATSTAALIDSDQDGLMDDEEKTLGTDLRNIDTDGDGLFDREEVKVYKTDPLKTDTDGDSYADGAEVKSGYNPNGPGKLYEIKK